MAVRVFRRHEALMFGSTRFSSLFIRRFFQKTTALSPAALVAMIWLLSLAPAAQGQCSPTGGDRTVTVCTPADGATVSSPFEVSAAATDAATVTAMQIYLDGALIFKVNASSFDTTVTAAAGSHRVTVKAWDATGAFSKVLNITVTSGGGGGSVTVTPASLNFGSQTVGSSSPTQTVTLSNGTSGSITVNGIAMSGDYSQQNNCGMGPFPTTLNAGGSCQVFVTFTPTASGTRTGSVTISTSDAGSPRTVLLTGSGGSTTGTVSGWLTYKFDNNRSGANTSEITLTPSNVNSVQFGRKLQMTVDGLVFGQPLYTRNLQ